MANEYVVFNGSGRHHGNVYRVEKLEDGEIALYFEEGIRVEDHENPWCPGTAYYEDYFEPTEYLPVNPKKMFGASKPDLSLIPPSALAHLAMSMEEGGWKYGPFNWRESKVESRTYIAAALRHLLDYLDGTDYAIDSEVLNLGAVMACCAIVIDAQECGTLIDNRPIPGPNAYLMEKLKEKKQEWAKQGKKQWSEGSKM